MLTESVYFSYCDAEIGLEYQGSLLLSFLHASEANQEVKREQLLPQGLH